MKRIILDFLKNDKIIFGFPFYLYYVLCVISMVPGIIDLWDKGDNFFFTIFETILYLTVIGVFVGFVPFAQWLYSSVNTLSFQSYEFSVLGCASITIWMILISFFLFFIFFPFFSKEKREDKGIYFWISSLLIYIVFLFFWRGKGLEDEDYFWLFIFPGIPIHTAILSKFFKI